MAPDDTTDPQFTWDDNHPTSKRFGDIYFNRAGGLEETNYVFLTGCEIPALFETRSRPVIAELGFGTGLNFLATIEQWASHLPCEGYLHFLSVEGYPLSKKELTEALEPWCQVMSFADDLINVYPAPRPHTGYQRLWLPHLRVCLTLLVGDAEMMLKELAAQVDAWFLDGFAPAKNPDMWSKTVLRQVARLSKIGTRLSTFTAAGDVRRGLESVGFDVQRKPGFARKRHMTKAIFTRRIFTHLDDTLPPWMRFSIPSVSEIINIAGAGIAGASVAHALTKRGMHAHVFDPAKTIASGASGNLAGMVKLKLDVDPSLGSLFQQSAFHYARSVYNQWPEAVTWSGCLDMASGPRDWSRFNKLAQKCHVTSELFRPAGAQDTEYLTGQSLSDGGAWLSTSGWCRPQELVKSLLTGAEISLGTDAPDGAILCSGPAAWARSSVNGALSMSPSLGQVTQLAARNADGLRVPISFGHYIIPVGSNRILTGATYDDVAIDAEPVATREADQRNLVALKAAIPSIQCDDIIAHRASVRATTPDHIPHIGPIPHTEWAAKAYAKIHQKKYSRDVPNLSNNICDWAVLGLRSRGLTTAPLAAELLVSQILGDPWPVPISQASKLAPIRDILRRLKA